MELCSVWLAKDNTEKGVLFGGGGGCIRGNSAGSSGGSSIQKSYVGSGGGGVYLIGWRWWEMLWNC